MLKDVWSYENMLELDTDSVIYKVPLEEGCKQIKLKKKNPSRNFDQSKERYFFLEAIKYPQ